MLPRLYKKGFTLIELMIVIAIVAILVSIAVPIFKINTMKARLTELTESMNATASALSAYYQDSNFRFPANDQTDITMLQSTLGVSIPNALYSRIASVHIAANTGVITFQIQSIDSSIDGRTLILSPTTTTEGAIIWSWGASAGFPAKLIPSK